MAIGLLEADTYLGGLGANTVSVISTNSVAANNLIVVSLGVRVPVGTTMMPFVVSDNINSGSYNFICSTPGSQFVNTSESGYIVTYFWKPCTGSGAANVTISTPYSPGAIYNFTQLLGFVTIWNGFTSAPALDVPSVFISNTVNQALVGATPYNFSPELLLAFGYTPRSVTAASILSAASAGVWTGVGTGDFHDQWEPKYMVAGSKGVASISGTQTTFTSYSSINRMTMMGFYNSGAPLSRAFANGYSQIVQLVENPLPS